MGGGSPADTEQGRLVVPGSPLHVGPSPGKLTIEAKLSCSPQTFPRLTLWQALGLYYKCMQILLSLLLFKMSVCTFVSLTSSANIN